MFRFVNSLISAQTSPVLRNTLPRKVDENHFRTSLDRYLFATINSRHRVAISVKADGTESVYPAGSSLTGLKRITGQRV